MRSWSTERRGYTPPIFFCPDIFIANKTLSVFIDESGDFGKYDPKSPYYYVSMVLHDQSVDISSEIENLEKHVANYGYPHHAIHVGPIIRREKAYEHDLMENRKSLVLDVLKDFFDIVFRC